MGHLGDNCPAGLAGSKLPVPKGPYNLEIIESCLGCVTREEGLFCQLPHGALATLNSIRQTSYYPRGAILYIEGETPRGVFVLCSGQAKLMALVAKDDTFIEVHKYRTGSVIGAAVVATIADPGT